MGPILALIRGVLSLATAVGVGYATWYVWKGNGVELAALVFSGTAVGRSVLLAWLRRNGEASQIFRNRATRFIRTPLQEFAFLAPLYAAPGRWTQFGGYTIIAVPALWIVLRGLVGTVLRTTAGEQI